MQIQIDSREKAKAITKIIAEFEQQNVQYYISKLYVGDYMNLDNPRLIIDRKQNLTEVYSNVITGHKRFMNEIRRANEQNIKLIFLVEHSANITCIDDVATWKNPQEYRYKKDLRKTLIDHHIISKFSDYPVSDMLELVKSNGIKFRKPPVPSEQLAKAMRTISERYCVEFQFCTKAQTGKQIIELLRTSHV